MAIGNSDLALMVGVNLNTQKAQKTLDQFTKKREITTEIKVKGIDAFKKVSTYVNQIGQSIKTTKIQDVFGNELSSRISSASSGFNMLNKETRIYTDTLGAVVTEVKKFDQYGNSMTTQVREYTDSLGQAIKETREFGSSGQQVGETIKEMTKDFVAEAEAQKKATEEAQKRSALLKQQMTDTSQTTKVTKELVDGYKAEVTTITEVNNKGETLITRISQYKNSMGETIKKTEQFDGSMRKIKGTMTEVSNSTKNLGQSFSDIVAKVSKFYLATLPMQMFTRVVSEAKETVVDFDKAITEMGKVSNYSGEQLKKFTRDLADMGSSVGRTMTEMTEATTGWIKAGYSEEDASRLAQYSALLQNTADEQLEASEATAILVSQLKAYHMEVEDTIKITDILNNVSAKEAVSSGDLAKGLTQASASLSTYGNTIEETTALLTAGTTIFQGKSQQVARGLNQIANRVAKNQEALKAYGVEIYDENNQLRSTYDILVDLAPQWEKMSKAEQVSLGTTLAGY